MASSRKSKRTVRSKRSTKEQKEIKELSGRRSGWKRFWDRYCTM